MGDERLDPSVLQLGLLNEVAERLKSVEDLLREQRMDGITEPFTRIITTTKQIIRAQKSWFSMTVINDGLSDINIVTIPTINENPHIIRFGETYRLDFGRGVISEIQVWCDTGTATLRFVGVR